MKLKIIKNKVYGLETTAESKQKLQISRRNFELERCHFQTPTKT